MRRKLLSAAPGRPTFSPLFSYKIAHIFLPPKQLCGTLLIVQSNSNVKQPPNPQRSFTGIWQIGRFIISLYRCGNYWCCLSEESQVCGKPATDSHMYKYRMRSFEGEKERNEIMLLSLPFLLLSALEDI